MNTKCTYWLPIIALQSLAALSAGAADRSGDVGSYATGTVGFLEITREPPLLTLKADPAFDLICEAAEATLSQLHCPYSPALNLTSRNFDPPSQIGQYLPHLRFTIQIDTIDHQAVAGGGIDNNADLNQFWFSWGFQSAVAERAQPDPKTVTMAFIEPDEEWGHVQPPMNVWHGQVENGCNPASPVDLMMRNRISRDNGPELGEVTLQDTFTGNGNYNVRYTVYAEEDDETANFVFKGHLLAYCTNELWHP
jgi:hypothetical protein